MSNIHKTILKATSLFSLVAGLVLSLHAETMLLPAALTGQGVTVLPQAGEVQLIQGGMHAAAFAEDYATALAGRDLVLGILLILLGFFLHAMLMNQREQDVPVRDGNSGRVRQWQRGGDQKWFWVELKI